MILLLLSAALAVDPVAPSWPEGAWLEVGEDEALYDEPATTEEELARRWREVQLHLCWPAALDDGVVAAYRILRGGRELARVAGTVRTWDVRVEDGPEIWAVVPVDADGNEGVALEGRLFRPGDQGGEGMLLLRGFGHSSGEGGTVSSVLAPRDAVDLDAALAGLPGDDVARTAITRVSLRVGRRGQVEPLLEERFGYDAHEGRTWMLTVDGRDLALYLDPESVEGRSAWALELHRWPRDAESRLSRLVEPDPASPGHEGSCALDTDYRSTGDLWIEWSIDPRGGDPRVACRGLPAAP